MIKNEYISCPYLESGISFKKNSIDFCCVAHSNNKGCTKICSYEGGEIPINEILDRRQQVISSIQKNENTSCKGCYLLEKRSWENLNNKFTNIILAYPDICDLSCNYCYVSKYNNKLLHSFGLDYDILDTFKSMAKNNLFAHNALVLLAAGEPTLHKKFDAIVEFSTNYNLLVTVCSNGVSYKNSIMKGLESNKLFLICSIDAGTSEVYSQIKGRDKFDVVIRNLKQYALAGERRGVQVKYIFTNENSNGSQVNEFINICVENKFNKIIISRNFTSHGVHATENKIDLPPAMIEGIIYMIELLVQFRLEFDISAEAFRSEEVELLEKLYITKNDENVPLKQIWLKSKYKHYYHHQ